MTNEEILKRIIEEKYQNVKAFSEKINIPYTTVRSILERGLLNAKVENVIRIADELNMRAEDMLLLSEKENLNKDLYFYFEKLTKDSKLKVIDFAKSKLDEQNTVSDNIVSFPTTLYLDAVVAAGTGEWQDDNFKEEIEYDGQIPNHDYVVRVNGDSMQPLFEDNQILFIRKTHEVRDGQIIVCMLNNETYVKKIMGNRLVSLNKKYKDILINEYDDFSVVGVVVL
ncbi:XRE family transcriptional regulator [Enterococcus cecorum]|uniref:XRE family transcriptional regulator n=1 Tax=Enterococcus cecorum TaxID=44008 RepID=A0AAW8TX01_9ENTE|nr:XRE family transcriptional regulator [Enterococcus cecorum]MDT2797378.1 XRE family transcriptional regulator [Enterococcus cecorum]